MRTVDAVRRYRPALGLAVEVIDVALGAVPDGMSAELVAACRAAVDNAGSNWWGCDTKADFAAEAAVPLRDVGAYVRRRYEFVAPMDNRQVREVWPDIEARLVEIGEALECAAVFAEEARQPLFGLVFSDWFRGRLLRLLCAPSATESLAQLASRVWSALAETDDYQRALDIIMHERHRPKDDSGWTTVGTRAATYRGDPYLGGAPAYLVLRSDYDDTAGTVTVFRDGNEPLQVRHFRLVDGHVRVSPTSSELGRAAIRGLQRLGLIE